MGDVYRALTGARIHSAGLVRIVEAGERVDIDDGRNNWLLVVQPGNWRREGAPNRWLRCVRPFLLHSRPPVACEAGQVVHGGDPRVAWGGRERFELVRDERQSA